MNDQSDEIWRQQYAEAIAIAASKVHKKPKEETPGERFHRIAHENEERQKTSMKRATKTWIKKKKIKTLTAYFKKK